MDRKTLQKICRDKGLYSTPDLNDHLYLHFQRFRRIEGLHDYVNVRALFLESNALERIENIGHMQDLTCLYLQQNCIERIGGLESNLKLTTINLQSNLIERVEGLDHLPALTTLNLADNHLSSLDSIEHLSRCTSLSSLDLSRNRLSDPGVVDVLCQLPRLACLYLKGNPFVNQIRHYRKTLICRIETLHFLDDRPVFADERRLAQAWLRGGKQGEYNERQAIQDSKARSAEEIVDAQARYAARLKAWKARKETEQSEGQPDLSDQVALDDDEYQKLQDSMRSLAVSYHSVSNK